MRPKHWIYTIPLRVRSLFRRERADAELDEELRYHVEQKTGKYMAKGMSEPEARRAAMVEMGGMEKRKEECRDTRKVNWIQDFVQDLRYALRMLRKSPGFAAVAILTLALGIGANTAIFSLLDAVLIRSLPYGDAGRLVYIWTPSRDLPQVPLEALGPSNGDFFDMRKEAHSFSALTLFEPESFNLATQGAAERVGGALVAPDFFTTLRVGPQLGRAISAEDMAPGSGQVALISHALWQTAFGGSAQALGKTVTLDGKDYQIIGVMPGSFRYPVTTELPYSNEHGTDVWVPRVLTPEEKADRDNPTGNALGRLRSGVSMAQAQAELGTMMPRLDALHSGTSVFKNMDCVVRGFTETVEGRVRSLIWLLFGAVSLVLLIACANAANLLLARAAGRNHEMGLRAALGARRERLIRQMLTEALLLAGGGGVLGVGIAYAAIRLLLRLNPGNIPRLNETSLDPGVLAFALGISIFTGVIFGILPAVGVSRTNLSELMKQSGNRNATGASKRWRHGLIIAEVGLAVVLLTGAGLLIRSYAALESAATGFSESTLTMNIALDARYGKPGQGMAFFHAVLERLGALRGVSAIGAVNDLPLSHSESLGLFTVEGYANKKGQVVNSRSATEDYFRAMGMPLVAGRTFAREDGAKGTPGVMIVNEAFAKAYFAGRSAVGGHVCMCFALDGGSKLNWSTVVGVVGNVRQSNLEDAPPAEVYQPFWQDGSDPDQAYIAIRSIVPAAQMIPAVRGVVRTIDPALAVAGIQTMNERVSEASALRRFQTALFGGFAGVALFLAAIGLYGVMAYTVRQRTAEIGIRMALGAQRSQVLKMIIGQGLLLTLAGIAVGVACALGLTRLLASLLYGVAPTDPATFMAVSAVLVGVALLACYVPARRAMRVDPMVALRYE